MDKITAPHIQQQLRLNRSVGAKNTDKTLFYLYLSMLEGDVSNAPRFADRGSTNEIVYADIKSHYYRHPNLQFDEKDFVLNRVFSKAANAHSGETLRLLNAMFPQGLSEKNNHLSISEEVINGLDYYARQRVSNAAFQQEHGIPKEQDSTDTNTIDVDETMLFDLIPQASEFAL